MFKAPMKQVLAEKYGKQYPTSFKVDFEGQPYDGACYYRITRCPICAYADKLGVRQHTLANGGDYCDYFITGDKE